MKNTKIAAIGTLSLILCACHHDNPLQSHSKEESAKFLMNASANVEKRLKFAGKEGDRGYGYMECMEGKDNPEINCQKLYLGMVSFAKEGHYPGFKSLNMKDLTDNAVFEKLADDYLEIMLSTEPKYFG